MSQASSAQPLALAPFHQASRAASLGQPCGDAFVFKTLTHLNDVKDIKDTHRRFAR